MASSPDIRIGDSKEKQSILTYRIMDGCDRLYLEATLMGKHDDVIGMDGEEFCFAVLALESMERRQKM